MEGFRLQIGSVQVRTSNVDEKGKKIGRCRPFHGEEGSRVKRFQQFLIALNHFLKRKQVGPGGLSPAKRSKVHNIKFLKT